MRLVSGEREREEGELEESLRPSTLQDYVGQEKVKESLTIFLQAALGRKEALDHLLLYGPPGLGKTTLAYIVAREMGVRIKATSGPAIERPLDLLVLLKTLQEGDVLFIDEIHRLPRSMEEILYPAMEDFVVDRIVHKGVQTVTAKIPLARFTLVGATTRGGGIAPPLRDRFGIIYHFDYYSRNDLEAIITRSARILKLPITEQGTEEIAARSRGTPRVANRLLRRVRDVAQVKGDGSITLEMAREALELLSIDGYGLDDVDRRYLTAILQKYGGGPVGIETLAAHVGEEVETLEEIYEPYLIQLGFLVRTPRGRCITPGVKKHLRGS